MENIKGEKVWRCRRFRTWFIGELEEEATAKKGNNG
jgi:hypothetical protein